MANENTAARIKTIMVQVLDLEFVVPQEHKARLDTTSDAREAKLMAQIPLSMYRQSISQERFIEIPEPLRDEYRCW